MNIVSLIMLGFAILGALDYILNNRFGIGKEFEKGFQLLGTMALTIIGMVVLAPFIAEALSPVLSIITEHTALDASVIAGSLLANDMGAATLSQHLAKTEDMAHFNGLVVGATMGATIAFTIPISLQMVEKSKQRLLFIGFLCGIVAIPIGCFFAGLIARLPITELLIDLIPLIVLAAVLAVGLLKFPNACVKAFRGLAICIKAIIIVGLLVGTVAFVTGYKLLPHIAPVEEGLSIIFNSAVVMSGAFPLLHIVGKLLRRPLEFLGQKIGINETAALGFVSTLATNLTTFGMMKDMDDKGVVLNGAFATAAAFTLASHLAFTLAIWPDYLPSVMVGKLVSGIVGVLIANFLYPLICKKEK